MTRQQLENTTLKIGTVFSILVPLIGISAWAWSADASASAAQLSADRNERRLDDHEIRLRECELQAARINAKLDAIADAVGAKKP